MTTYIVQGEAGAEVDVLGTTRAVGSEVELEAEAAAPLVESGVLKAKEEAAG
jgi:hypothetical protein